MPKINSQGKEMVHIETSSGSLYIHFTQRWAYISCIRSFIESVCAITLNDKNLANSISIASSELLENAIKYSDNDDVEITLQFQKDKIGLSVRNHTDDHHLQVLRKEIEKIKRGSPKEAYQRKIREIANNEDVQSLGLARIRIETNPEIVDMKESENIVTVFANFPFPNL